MTDPTNVFAMDDIKFMTGYNVEPVVASETAVIDAIRRYYAPPRRARRKASQRRRRQRAGDARSRWSPRRSRRCRSVVDDDVEVLEELEEIDVDVARASRAARRRSSSW